MWGERKSYGIMLLSNYDWIVLLFEFSLVGEGLVQSSVSMVNGLSTFYP